MGDQAWNFDDTLAAYEPVKGYLEPPGTQGSNPTGNLAVWKLRLVKDFEAGTIAFHEQVRGSPFKVVLLDADRTVINPDAPAQITAPSGKMGDTIELYVALPENSRLLEVRIYPRRAADGRRFLGQRSLDFAHDIGVNGFSRPVRRRARRFRPGRLRASVRNPCRTCSR